MYTVLVDAAGTVTCQSVIRGLRSAEGLVNRIVTIDTDPKNAGRFMSDSFYVCPSADSSEYVDFICDLVDEESIDIVIPIVDTALLTLSDPKYVSVLEDRIPSCDVIVSPYYTNVVCDNKAMTYDMFVDAGLPTPTIYDNLNDIDKFPVFIKPLTGGRASIGCERIDSMDKLKVVIDEFDDGNFLIMDHIYGQEYTIDVICTLDGVYITGLARKRLMTKSGVSYKAEVVHDERLLHYAKQLVKHYDFFGPLNIQCIVDENDNPFFIEVNPRFSGTLAATIGAGLNTVEILLASIYNPTLVEGKEFKYTDGYMLRYWADVFIPKSYFG